MKSASQHPWLLLIHQIPQKPDYLRVKAGRRLHQIGSVALKRSVYALPSTPRCREAFEWTLREITAGGGEGVICETSFVEGLTDERVRGMFNKARDADYEAIAREATELRATPVDRAGEGEDRRAQQSLGRLQRSLASVQEIDFFSAPGCRAAEMAVATLEAEIRRLPADSSSQRHLGDLVGHTWITRAGIEEDRMASAWLIRRFIDAEASFRFVPTRRHSNAPGELRFDMYEGEFTHDGERCTFEVLLDHTGIDDPALRVIAEIVHDIDLHDEKFARPETPGIARVIRGIVASEARDEERLASAMLVLDLLHEGLKRGEAEKGAPP